MSKPIIEVRSVSKRYSLGAIGATSLREEVSRYWDRLHGRPHPSKEDFWALRDVSLDIQPGEVVGVIGRNGAGKSTLLKILSRITEPTGGTATLRGRVASLLEVGTGFHPELSGRDNVYLNGAILGMTRAEVRRKFDEIVAFAEVEQFIDTPVKRYSSGMYVRLAFAVAAHLEPEILIIDEVLAVGDAGFQAKCLGRIRDISEYHGRTVLFVSHNTEAVTSLCTRCLLLQNGTLVDDGAPRDIVGAYLATDRQLAQEARFEKEDRPGQFEELAVTDRKRSTKPCFSTDEAVTITASVVIRQPIPGLQMAVELFNLRRELLFYSSTAEASVPFLVDAEGRHRVSATIPARLLLPGQYLVSVALHRPKVVLCDERKHVLSFEVVRPPGGQHAFSGAELGAVHVDIAWRHESVLPIPSAATP